METQFGEMIGLDKFDKIEIESQRILRNWLSQKLFE